VKGGLERSGSGSARYGEWPRALADRLRLRLAQAAAAAGGGGRKLAEGRERREHRVACAAAEAAGGPRQCATPPGFGLLGRLALVARSKRKPATETASLTFANS